MYAHAFVCRESECVSWRSRYLVENVIPVVPTNPTYSAEKSPYCGWFIYTLYIILV